MRFPTRYSIGGKPFEAVRTLAEYLQKLAGTPPQENGYPIRLTLLPPSADAPRDGGDERFKIEVTQSGATLTAHSLRAAFFAVYSFLEDFCGCCFLTESVEHLPENPDLIIGQKAYAPAFSYREVYWRGALQGDFALKMKLNSARADISDAQGGRVRFFNYSHSFETLIPPEEYFDEHPEYFSCFEGARQRDKSQLCLTNEDVFQIVLQKVRVWMRENPAERIFSVSQNDWYGACECAQCRALAQKEGSEAGVIVHFVNRVADEIREEFPDNFIHTFAYLYSRAAPLHVRPRSNVIVRLCAIECCYAHDMAACDSAIDAIDVVQGAAHSFQKGARLFRDDLAAWGRIAPNLYIWDYTTNYAHYLAPFPNLHVLKPNLQLMRAHHVTGVFEQGNYAKGNTSAFAALKIYILSKLLWDPDADDSALVQTFVEHYYGAAAPYILNYIHFMEETVQHAHMGVFDAADAPAITDEALKKGRALMNAALNACQTPLERERVDLEALSIDYLSLTRLPLDAPDRDAQIDDFAARIKAHNVTELFERRALKESLLCMKKSRFAKDRSGIPYTFYRL